MLEACFQHCDGVSDVSHRSLREDVLLVDYVVVCVCVWCGECDKDDVRVRSSRVRSSGVMQAGVLWDGGGVCCVLLDYCYADLEYSVCAGKLTARVALAFLRERKGLSFGFGGALLLFHFESWSCRSSK